MLFLLQIFQKINKVMIYVCIYYLLFILKYVYGFNNRICYGLVTKVLSNIGKIINPFINNDISGFLFELMTN